MTHTIVRRGFLTSLCSAMLAATVLFFFFYRAFIPQPVLAADNALTYILLSEFANTNGKIDLIQVQIDNDSGNTAAVHDNSGWTVTDGGNNVDIASVSIAGSASADPITINIVLDENDADLTVDTLNTDLEVSYVQQGSADTGTEYNDAGDVQLVAIAADDTGAAAEADGAAPVPVSATFYDGTSDDGKLDLITVVWSEDINAVADGSADWALTSSSDFSGISEGTVECNSGSAGTNECDYNFTTTTVKTDVGDLSLDYSGSSVTDGTTAADIYTITSASSPSFSDGAKPIITAADFTDGSFGVVTTNALSLTYSEPVQASLDAAGDSDITSGGEATGTATMGAMGTARTVAGLATWGATNGGDVTTSLDTGDRVALSADAKTITVKFTAASSAAYITSTSAPTTPDVTPVEDANDLTDLSGNPANSSQTAVTATNSTVWDVTAPTVSAVRSCDNNQDGVVEQLFVTFSEDIHDASITLGSLEGDNDSTNNGTGEENPSSFSTTHTTCGGGLGGGSYDDQGSFNFATGFSGTDSAYLHNVTAGLKDQAGNRLATGDGLGTEFDSAKPVISNIFYSDNDGDGMIDRVQLVYSETIVASSFLSANDLTFSDVGDFTGMAFGTDGTDLITGSVTSTIIDLGTEATVVDTRDDSGNFEVTSQNAFSLSDGLTSANTTLDAQTQSTITDTAGPVISSITPGEDETGAEVTQDIVVVFSESMDTTGVGVGAPASGEEFEVSPDPGGLALAWSNSDQTVTISHTDFSENTTYTVTTDEAALNAASGNPTALATTGPEDGDWSFTTVRPSSGSSGGSTQTITYSISLSVPSGGETYAQGEVIPITWATGGNGTINYVNIYASYDGGTTYTQIAQNERNDGSYDWTAPALDTTSAMIRIDATDLAQTLTSDESNSIFTIGSTTSTDSTEEDTTEDDSTDETSGNLGPSPITGLLEEITPVSPGEYVKSPSFPTIYYIGSDMKRHPFMDEQTFFTWQDNFDNIKEVTDATLPTLGSGVLMLPKPGVVTVKMQIDARVYWVEENPSDAFKPILRHVETELVAADLFGAIWADYVIDIPSTLFTRFEIGEPITDASEVSIDLMQMKFRSELLAR